jgi:hypothetical protein
MDDIIPVIEHLGSLPIYVLISLSKEIDFPIIEETASCRRIISTSELRHMSFQLALIALGNDIRREIVSRIEQGKA